MGLPPSVVLGGIFIRALEHRPPGPDLECHGVSSMPLLPGHRQRFDFQRFERAKSSAGLGAHPPYCTDRFCGGRVPASRRRAHRSWWGLRAKWPHAKCGAAALFCGVPPRLTPWAVRNSLGLPTGVFWLPTWPKMSFNRISRVSAVFEVAP